MEDVERIETADATDAADAPPSCAAKCLDLTHLKSAFGKLQIVQIVIFIE